MKWKRMCKMSIFFVVILITTTMLVSTVSAKNENQYGSIEPELYVAVDSHQIPTEEEQKYVLEAINKSYLSESKKMGLIKDLDNLWSNSSLLSQQQQNEILNETSQIVIEYYGLDVPKMQIEWAGAHGYNPDGTHNALAQIAGQKMGLSSSRCRILNEHSCDPDYWGTLQMTQHYSWGGAGSKAKEYADIAKAKLQVDRTDPEGWENLSWAMHFMSDVANPWHTQQLWAQLNHNTYEFDYVQAEMVTGHNFKQVLIDSPDYWWYTVTDPTTSTNNLAALSSQYFDYINNKINNDPTGWKNDTTVIADTEDVLEEALHYNMGLIDYVI